MPEKVLPLPLSGEEIRKAVLAKVGEALQRDCFLSANLAYDYYTAHVKVTLRAHDIGRTVEVSVDETATLGEETEDMHLDTAESEFDIDAAPPNEVRVETGQPVPVMTKGTDGKAVQRGIKYSKNQLAKAR